jgi:hypothetical protein
MMPEWFLVWFDRHTRRFQRSDWPALGAEEHAFFCLGWIEAFKHLAVTPEEAEAASRRLQARAPKRRDDHLGALLDLVRAARVEALPRNCVARAEHAAYEARRQRWERFTDGEKAQIFQEACVANPELAKLNHLRHWRALLLPWCLEEMDRRAAREPARLRNPQTTPRGGEDPPCGGRSGRGSATV